MDKFDFENRGNSNRISEQEKVGLFMHTKSADFVVSSKSFDFEKRQFLSKKDKSIAGEIDKHIRKLCSIINKKKNFYTTSSCAGRIVIIERTEKKNETNWLLKSHEKAKLKDVFTAIKKIASFRFEPTILHLCARKIEDAGQLLHLFYNNGFKRSGIISIKKKIVIEVIGTGRIEAPITKETPKEYVELLVKEANELWEMNYNRIKKIENILNILH